MELKLGLHLKLTAWSEGSSRTFMELKSFGMCYQIPERLF